MAHPCWSWKTESRRLTRFPYLPAQLELRASESSVLRPERLFCKAEPALRQSVRTEPDLLRINARALARPTTALPQMVWQLLPTTTTPAAISRLLLRDLTAEILATPHRFKNQESEE